MRSRVVALVRVRVLVLMLACACLPGVAQAACRALQPAVAAGAEHSRWQELAPAPGGRRLVLEQGTLASLLLQATQPCDGWRWQAALGLAQGRRAYQGFSSTGMAVVTQADIRRLRASLAVDWPVPLVGTLLGDGAATVGLALHHANLWRDIASAGAVRGYPEHFSQWQLAGRLAINGPLRPGLRWQLGLALGGGPPGRLLLLLPQADAALLRLGSSRMASLALGLQFDAGWGLQLQWLHERSGAGAASALRRGGVVVGAAAQPAIRQSGVGLQLRLPF